MKYGVLIYDKVNFRNAERGGNTKFLEFESEEKFLEWIKFNPTMNFRAITFNDVVVEHSLSISEQ